MHPEHVLTMVTEKSLNIKDTPGGGKPEFTTEDARHALGHMLPKYFNYCQYVYLLYDNKLRSLALDVCDHICLHYSDKISQKDYDIIARLCDMACREQRTSGRITDKTRYEHLKIKRSEWRYKWKNIFSDATQFLNELNEGVKRHIYLKTR